MRLTVLPLRVCVGANIGGRHRLPNRGEEEPGADMAQDMSGTQQIHYLQNIQINNWTQYLIRV